MCTGTWVYMYLQRRCTCTDCANVLYLNSPPAAACATIKPNGQGVLQVRSIRA